MYIRYNTILKLYLIKYLKNRKMNNSSLIIPRDCYLSNQDQNRWTQNFRIHGIRESPNQIQASATATGKIGGQCDVTKATSLQGILTY